VIRAEFSGGPFSGVTLMLAGTPPGYMLLVEHPADPSYPAPIVVGADFDDGWPGQQRYVLHTIYTGDPEAIAIYIHQETPV